MKSIEVISEENFKITKAGRCSAARSASASKAVQNRHPEGRPPFLLTVTLPATKTPC